MKTPYSNLPPERYWRTGVAESHPSTVSGLYKKKFEITADDAISTAGSCFAQHVARHMRARGYRILDAEPPILGTPDAMAKKYGYNIYSARYGNIYTARQFRQLLRDAHKGRVDDEDIWEKNGRFYDGIRPNVEPDGLASREDVRAMRLDHLERVLNLFQETDVLVFTLGLTEAWRHRGTGRVYPTCPGVIAGQFDDATYEFVNFGFNDVLADLKQVRIFLKKLNPSMRFLLTVSPVPLTATASDKHVLVATTYSKSVLRAVCGELSSEFDDVDYFPSYEMIASPFSKGFFYDSNQREVTDMGVEAVMRVLFSEHSAISAVKAQRDDDGDDDEADEKPARARSARAKKNDVVCEEALLEAFAK